MTNILDSPPTQHGVPDGKFKLSSREKAVTVEASAHTAWQAGAALPAVAIISRLFGWELSDLEVAAASAFIAALLSAAKSILFVWRRWRLNTLTGTERDEMRDKFAQEMSVFLRQISEAQVELQKAQMRREEEALHGTLQEREQRETLARHEAQKLENDRKMAEWKAEQERLYEKRREEAAVVDPPPLWEPEPENTPAKGASVFDHPLDLNEAQPQWAINDNEWGT